MPWSLRSLGHYPAVDVRLVGHLAQVDLHLTHSGTDADLNAAATRRLTEARAERHRRVAEAAARDPAVQEFAALRDELRRHEAEAVRLAAHIDRLVAERREAEVTPRRVGLADKLLALDGDLATARAALKAAQDRAAVVRPTLAERRTAAEAAIKAVDVRVMTEVRETVKAEHQRHATALLAQGEALAGIVVCDRALRHLNSHGQGASVSMVLDGVPAPAEAAALYSDTAAGAKGATAPTAELASVA